MALLLATSGCAPVRRPPSFALRHVAPLAGIPQGNAALPQPAWWKRYNDPQLDRLMDLATQHSPDLQQAEARYEAAERAVDAQHAQLNPQVRGLLDSTHAYSKVGIHAQPSGAPGPLQNLDISPKHSWSNSGLAAALLTWDLDLWGKQKDAIAQAAGEANAMRADQAMAANSLHYGVAKAYFDWQSMQTRVQLARASTAAASQFLSLEQVRVKAGLDDPQQLDRADAQLADQRRSQAMLEGQSALNLAQLAAVIGVSERELGELKAQPWPHIDADIPPDASLALLARRPDIVANRWEIEASIQGIDEARAAYYPDVSLMGLGAFLRLYPNLGSGTHANIALGSIGPSFSLPIFSGGRLKAQVEINQAQLDTAVASYNHTVVQAAHDVAEQVLTLQQIQAVQVQTDQQLADVGRQNDRADRRRQRGLDDDRTWLGLQLQLNQVRDSQLQIADQLMSTHLALIYALGGGYRDTSLPSLPSTSSQASR
ncbi:efflux transporter outer membrane subunit [Dyella sp. 7MK23]|uniref:Efflux transporter outer membrane subunit n=1 Tax=Dyella acidiphila TaxID=2775866 RepID=A0ABR9GBW3_9GAMM|nr:efflux transporter outer membrane subunit [Dyella acidiphila]